MLLTLWSAVYESHDIWVLVCTRYKPTDHIHTGITTVCNTTHSANISQTILGFPLSPCIQLLILDYSSTRSDRDYRSTYSTSKLIHAIALRSSVSCFRNGFYKIKKNCAQKNLKCDCISEMGFACEKNCATVLLRPVLTVLCWWFYNPGPRNIFFYFIFLFQKKSLAVTLRIFPTLSSFYVHVTLAVECVVDYMLRCTSWGACPTQSSHQPSLLY